ncbi:MAG: type I DNA topoisomerase [Victivallaceae bacterium]|nr:type I DNA topoisomerase [Victivallaceae bacterium]
MSKLLIVESPTKARTITKMLGKDYVVRASMGHIRDLPEHSMGVDVKNGFVPRYIETPRSRRIVQDLKSEAAKAKEIYLATDPDREGEAIAWHLKEVLAPVTKAPFRRVTFHEITRSAIERGLSAAGDIDLNLVDAQQARRVLDRIVGYKVSPLLWRKLSQGRSAGRVQSAALRLVVERERSITEFKPEEYWTFAGTFVSKGGEIQARLNKIDDEAFVISCEKDAKALMDAVENGSVPVVSHVSAAEKQRHAPPPFTTSTMQQVANTSHHFSASRTMQLAQQLYEGVDIGNRGSVGLITYMRTDSVTLSLESQIAAKAFITENYGAEYAPEVFNHYRNKAAAEEAHEAIRPSNVELTPESVAPYLDDAQLKLYTLIWNRFVASQMKSAVQIQHAINIDVRGADAKTYQFHASALVVKFEGYLKVFSDYTEKHAVERRNAKIIVACNEKDELGTAGYSSERKFTEPPERFSEATLIKALEENGIGRPSTYASTLKTIQDREYVKREKGKLVPSELGFTVNDFLVSRLPELFNIGYTAKMESDLDGVEEGRIAWAGMVGEFHEWLLGEIGKANEIDAPSVDSSRQLLDLLKDVKFEPMAKIGGKSYDDGKFFNSIYEGASGTGKVSNKQFDALIGLAAKYREQLSDEALSALPDGLAERIAELGSERTEEVDIDYPRVFSAFGRVIFKAPEKRGRTSFDEKRFFDSLHRQAQSGRRLTEKQMLALARIASRHVDELEDKEFLMGVLPKIEPPKDKRKDDAPDATSKEKSNPDVVAKIFEGLAKTEFNPPVKRGLRVYDDASFVRSLETQFKEKGALSDRQVNALKKMAVKYGVEL